jgi:transposase
MTTLTQINLNAAGIDIGSKEIWVCVPEGRDESSVKCYGSYTEDLRSISKWLKTCGVKTVAMESTGIYWIPLYEVLGGDGFEVCLINSRQIKNVNGRKSDIADCQWIQQLHTYGLLKSSFIVDKEIKRIRELNRQRENLLRTRSTHILRMQKSLEVMNIKITEVLSDITGATGLRIIRDILSGKRDPEELSNNRDFNCKSSKEEIKKALDGNYLEEQVFILQQELGFYEYCTKKIEECDKYTEELFSKYEKKLASKEDLKNNGEKKKKPNKNTPRYDLSGCLYEIAGVDLTQVDGLSASTVQTILSEIGTDMSKWDGVKNFTSWLKLCPNNAITGGKVIYQKSSKTKNRATQALKMAALALTHSDSWLGRFYRRKRATLGPAKAIVATAHKLAKIVYHMLKFRVPYKALDKNYFEDMNRERLIKNLKTRASKFGFILEPILAD